MLIADRFNEIDGGRETAVQAPLNQLSAFSIRDCHLNLPLNFKVSLPIGGIRFTFTFAFACLNFFLICVQRFELPFPFGDFCNVSCVRFGFVPGLVEFNEMYRKLGSSIHI